VDSFEKQTKWVTGLNEIRGKKGIIPPGKDAKPEDIKSFADQVYDLLGRPKEGKYNFTLPEGSKDEAYSDEFMNGLADIAFESGMSEQGFQKLVDKIATSYNEQLAEWSKFVEETKKKLGEDRMEDKGDASLKTKADLHDEAKAKRIEAENLYRKGDYKGAERLKQESDDLYSRLA
jgi:hypothetical protein